MKTTISSMLGLGAAVAVAASAFWFGVPGEPLPIQEPTTHDPGPYDEDAARADLDRLTWMASYREGVIAALGDDRCNVNVTVSDVDTGLPVEGARTDVFWMTNWPHWVPIAKFPTTPIDDDIGGDSYTLGCFGDFLVRLASLPSGYEPAGFIAEIRRMDPDTRQQTINLFAVRRDREPLQQVRALVLERTPTGLEPYQGATVTFDWGERRRFEPAAGAYVLERDIRPQDTEADGRTKVTTGRGHDVVVVELEVPDGYRPVGPSKETLDYRPLSPENDPTPNDPDLNQMDKLADELEMPTFYIEKQAPGTTDRTEDQGEDQGRDDEGEGTIPPTPVEALPPAPVTRPVEPAGSVPPTTRPAAPAGSVPPTTEPAASAQPAESVPPTTTQPPVPVTRPAAPAENVAPAKPEVTVNGRVDQAANERGPAEER